MERVNEIQTTKTTVDKRMKLEDAPKFLKVSGEFSAYNKDRKSSY